MFENYNEAVRLIRLYSELVSFQITPCSEETINSAEALLGVKFPHTYRLFLKDFGRLYFGGSSIMGIFENKSENSLEESGMVDYTLEGWKDYGVPRDFVVIEDEGEDGEFICLQINKKDPDKSLVISYIVPEQSSSVLAPDFGTFFLDWVKEEIEIYHEENPDVPRKF